MDRGKEKKEVERKQQKGLVLNITLVKSFPQQVMSKIKADDTARSFK